MSTTMIVCLIIIGICTIVIISSTVIADRAYKKMVKHNKEADSKPEYKFITGAERYKAGDSKAPELKMQMYHKWLPYRKEFCWYANQFECSKCHNITAMPINEEKYSVEYFEYCPHCGSMMLHKEEEF